MTSTLTEKFHVNNIQNFFDDITSGSNSYYFWVGKTTAWANDSLPDPALNDYENFSQSIFHDIVMGKQITNSNISFLIPNTPWANNIGYAQYDANDPNMFSENFYVVNNLGSVYLCVDNNNGSNSVIQPLITPTQGTFQTADGYTWKYFYTIPVNANTLFTTNTYIPVVPNTYVSNNAIPGTIDVTRVVTGGTNWQGYNEGFLTVILSQNSVKLANTAAMIDNFYVGSSIYLKAGLGANQLRTITSYSGLNQTATVQPAFNTYVNLYLANNAGTFIVGETVEQEVVSISYIYASGLFNQGDTLVQSDSQAAGLIYTTNSIMTMISQTSNVNFSVASGAYPIVDTVQAPTLKAGVVSINAFSNVITGGAGANLQVYSPNQFIQVGSNNTNNIRRIASITNSSMATVSVPFNNTLVNNSHSLVSYAFEPISSEVENSNGSIVQVNLGSMIVQYGNVSSNNISFIIGESLKEYDANNVDQASNGVISYVNSTAIILSSVSGVISSGLFLTGQSSDLTAQITSISSYPNITLANSEGAFLSGNPITVYYANGSSSGNATVLSASYSPSGLTEYIVSPQVVFEGDGSGAQAYASVNTAQGANYTVDDIVMISTGTEYTIANAYLVANSQYGSGANLYPVLSPVQGHGANSYTELGATYGGISVTFDTALNENYYFPSYGSYRRLGIIKNPLFNSLYVNTDNVHRSNASINIIGANSFLVGEIVYQSNTGSAAVVNYANSTYLELKDISGTFVSHSSNAAANNIIQGLASIASANLMTILPESFNLVSNNQLLYQSNSGANGVLLQVVSNNQLLLTDVSGKFAANTIIYDPTSNAYANVVSLFAANDTANVTTTFGMKFDQTTRLTLSSNNLAFQVGEYVNQAVSNASGLIIDTTHEVDLIYTTITGSVGSGILLTDANTGATGVVTYSNATYIKMTAANGQFFPGDRISTITSNSTVVSSLPVLVLGDLENTYAFQYGNNIITGNTSGASGLNGVANTLTYPDLVRNSGDVLYISNISPYTKTANTKETLTIVVSM